MGYKCGAAGPHAADIFGVGMIITYGNVVLFLGEGVQHDCNLLL